MVKFGDRLNGQRNTRFETSYCNYEQLKALLEAVKGKGPKIGVENFADPCGLVEARGGGDLGVGCLRAGLSDEERDELLQVRRCSGPSTAIPKVLSMTSLRKVASFHRLDDMESDGSRHWTRYFFRSQLSRAVLVHGFDVALTAELEKVEARYRQELDRLATEWQHHYRDHLLSQPLDVTAKKKLRRPSFPSLKTSSSSPRGERFFFPSCWCWTPCQGTTWVSWSERRRRRWKIAAETKYDSFGNDEAKQVTFDLPQQQQRGASASEADDDDNVTAVFVKKTGMSPSEAQSLKLALGQLDQDCGALADFGFWNYQAFVKITKKRDKWVPNEAPLMDIFCEKVRKHSGFWQATASDALKDELRDNFAKLFCDGDMNEAVMELRSMASDATRNFSGYERDAMRFGYLTGIAACLGVWVMWDCFEVVDSVHEKHFLHQSVMMKPAGPIFRACGELVAWHWMYGWCLDTWFRHRVNSAYIFETALDATKGEDSYVSAHDVYEEAAVETVTLLSLLLVYYKATYRGGLPRVITDHVDSDTVAAVVPTLLVVGTVLRLVFPWARRRHLWLCFGRIVRAPFSQVRFVDTYVADVLSSMVRVLLDVLWTTCFFASGEFYKDPLGSAHQKNDHFICITRTFYRSVAIPIFCLLPLWSRFAQCLRKYHDAGTTIHLQNAAKYVLSLFVALSSALNLQVTQKWWFLLFVISSLFSFWWDVTKDWGLCIDPRSPAFLDRPNHPKMYPMWYYPAAVIIDIPGRFAWLSQLMPPTGYAQQLEKIMPEYFVPILALFELLRRCIWGFFRLEQEHVDNAFQHRKEYQFVPAHFTRRAAQHEIHERQKKRRCQSFLEAFFICALVVALLVVMTLSSIRGGGNGGGSSSENHAVPSPTPGPSDYDDFFGFGTAAEESSGGDTTTSGLRIWPSPSPSLPLASSSSRY